MGYRENIIVVDKEIFKAHIERDYTFDTPYEQLEEEIEDHLSDFSYLLHEARSFCPDKHLTKDDKSDMVDVVYKSEELRDDMSDRTLMYVDKQTFAELIPKLFKRIGEHYIGEVSDVVEMIQSDDKEERLSSIGRLYWIKLMFEDITGEKMPFKSPFLHLDRDEPFSCSNWIWDLFNLVILYREVDWENETVLLYGW